MRAVAEERRTRALRRGRSLEPDAPSADTFSRNTAWRRAAGVTTINDLDALSEIAAAIVPDLALEEVQTRLAQRVARIMGASRCEICDDRQGAGELTQTHMNDPELDPSERRLMKRRGEKSCLSTPLRIDGEVVGGLRVIETGRVRHFTDEDGELLRRLAVLVAFAIRDAKTNERHVRQNRQMAQLFEATRAVTSTLVLEDVLTMVARTTAEVMGTFAADIFDYSAADNAMISSGYWALEITPEDDEYLGYVISLDERPGYYPCVTDPRLLERQLDDPDCWPPGEREISERWDEKSSLMAPLMYGGELIGLLGCTEKRFYRRFSEVDKVLFQQLAVPAALAIHNARVYRQQERQARRFASLVDASRAITSSLVLDDVLVLVARTAAETLGCPECIIYDYDEATDTLTSRSLYNAVPTDHSDPGKSRPVSATPSDRALPERGEIKVDTLSDPDLNPGIRDSMEERDEKTCLNVPLSLGDEPLGMFVLIETERERAFTEDEIELARGLSEHAALALHNARLFQRLELHSHETALLNDIARAASASLSVPDIAAAAMEQLRRLTQFDRASLLMRREDGVLDVVYSTEEASRLLGMVRADVDADFLARLEQDRVAILRLPDDLPLGPEREVGHDLRSAAVVGLYDAGRLIGALALGTHRENAYSDRDRRVLDGMSAQLSLAVRNARLYDNVRRLHLGNLRALSSALTAKDFYTSGHTARVTAYVTLLARELGWSSQAITELQEATYLHDIGKIAISDRVLLKSGPLADEEWSLMRQHPAIGAEILAPLFDERFVAAIRYHHERYDGTGYPDGLAGDEIPEIARLLCVVDAYDAMSSRRVYRKALTYRECLDELGDCRGTQFDPAIVDAFVRVLRGLEARRRLVSAAAQVAAGRVDAETLMCLREPADEAKPEYAHVLATLRQVRAEFPRVETLVAETKVDEKRCMIVVDSDEDSETRIRLGEVAFSCDLELEVFAGHAPESNVLSVDSWGTWVTGAAPIHGETAEVVALVCANISPADGFELRGLAGDVNDTFAGLARSAAARLTQAETDAMTDPLTGLYNHRYMQEHLETAVREARASGNEISLLFCDLDRFKDLNDRLGHAAGDEVLRSVAQILAQSLRPSDVAARYGGDEFAIALLGVDGDAAGAIAERIRSSVETAALGTADGALTISIGVAALDRDAGAKEELLERADQAMYAAKREGRNRVVAFPLM
jgi:diguanylate cyclase (GGDEF)-like protein